MNLPAPTKTLLEKNVKEGSGVKKKLIFEIDRLNGFLLRFVVQWLRISSTLTTSSTTLRFDFTFSLVPKSRTFL